MDEMPDIDPRFYNSETNAPFTDCLICHKELIESDSEYLIEKVMRRVPTLDLEEVLFEYAVCLDCAHQTHHEMSEESKKAVELFFQQKINYSVLHKEGDKLDQCLFTGQDISESSEYSFHAQCRGDRMVQSIFPYAVSDTAMDEIVEVLSEKTLDDFDDFKAKYFGGPPELEEVLGPRRLLPI